MPLKDLSDGNVEDAFEAGCGANRKQRRQEAAPVTRGRGLRFGALAVARDQESEINRMW